VALEEEPAQQEEADADAGDQPDAQPLGARERLALLASLLGEEGGVGPAEVLHQRVALRCMGTDAARGPRAGDAQVLVGERGPRVGDAVLQGDAVRIAAPAPILLLHVGQDRRALELVPGLRYASRKPSSNRLK
jgi:hypothetical protein